MSIGLKGHCVVSIRESTLVQQTVFSKNNQVELNHCGVTILSMDESLIINDWFEKTSLSRRLITVNVGRNTHAIR